MRKAKLLLVSVFALSGLVSISSCSDGGSDTPTPTTYKVTTAAGEGTTISLTGDKTEFSGGEIVTFTVALSTEDSTKEIKTVKFGDTSLAVESDGTYEVAMPNENVTITTTAGDVETPVEPTPIDKTYKVTLKEGLGSKITLSAEEGVNTFTAGTELSFSVTLDNSDLTVLNEVKVGGKVVSKTDGLYTFTMPNKDVEIETVTTALGDGSLLTPSDVDETVISNITSVESLTTFLEETATKAEQTYINGGTAKLSNTDINKEEFEYTFRIGLNNVSEYEGKYFENSKDVLDVLGSVRKGVRGIKGDYYYEVKDNSASGKEGSTSILVDDTETSVPTGSMKRSDALAMAGTAGLTEHVVSYLSNFSGVTPVVTKDSTNKYFTISLNKIVAQSLYLDFYEWTMELRFDGDNAITSALITQETYTKEDYDDVSGAFKEDSVPVDTLTFNLNATRGYRRNIVPILDINDYVGTDYRVFAVDSSNTVEVPENGDVEYGDNYSFCFKNNLDNPMLVAPKIKEVKSEEGVATINGDGKSIHLAKGGEFTVVFDNGLGDLKEVKFNSVRPAVTGLKVSLSSSTTFVGSAVTLTVLPEPTLADNSATATVKEGSTGSVEITDNKDGTFKLVATKKGACTIVVTSTENSKISTEVSLTIGEAIDYETIKSLLTTNTLYYRYKDRYTITEYYLNFNDDGKGQFRIDEDGTGEVITFTYALNENPIELTYTLDDEDATSSGYKLVGFSIASSTEVAITVDYHGSADTYTLKSKGEKIDLAA